MSDSSGAHESAFHSFTMKSFLLIFALYLSLTTAQVCNVNNGYQITSISSSGDSSGSSDSSGDSSDGSGDSSDFDDSGDDSGDSSDFDDSGDDGSDDFDDSGDDSGDDDFDDSGDDSGDSDDCNGDASCEELLGDEDMLDSGSLSAVTAEGFADQDAGLGKRSTFTCTASQTCFVYQSIPLCINVKTGDFDDPSGGYGNLMDGSYTPSNSSGSAASTGAAAPTGAASATGAVGTGSMTGAAVNAKPTSGSSVVVGSLPLCLAAMVVALY